MTEIPGDLSALSTEELRNIRDGLERKAKAEPIKDSPVVALRGELPADIGSGDPEAWRSQLLFSAEGQIKPRVMTNFFVMINLGLTGLFGWNSIARTVYVMRPPPWVQLNGRWKPRPLIDEDLTGCSVWLERKGLTPRTTETGQAIVAVARGNEFHPVKDYLAGLAWDHCPRIQGGMWEGASMPSLAVDMLGAPEDRIYTVFLARWLLSAVARTYQPGCKADCILILEGEQGTMKSTFLKTLAGEEYFTDSIMDIESKDAALQMQGVWIAEIPELNAFQPKEAAAIKSWLSRSTDKFRPPYGRITIDYPRHSVIAGTMNPLGYGYIRDPSGARRFWPIPVLKKIDIDRVAAERDQIWAEAVDLYHRKKRWHLTKDEEAIAGELTEERHEEEPWAHKIETVIRRSARFTTADVISELGIPASQQSQATSRRVGSYLRRRGFEKGRTRVDGDREYYWSRKLEAEE